MPTASSRWIAEHLGRPTVVRAAQFQLEPGVVGRETRLQREGGEDHLGRHAVAQLVVPPVAGVPVADDRELAFRRRHQLAGPQPFDEEAAPVADDLDARHVVAVLGGDALAVEVDRLGDVRVGGDVDHIAVRHRDTVGVLGSEHQTAAAGRHQHVLGAVDLVGRGAAHLADALEDVVHAVDVRLAQQPAVGCSPGACRRARCCRRR